MEEAKWWLFAITFSVLLVSIKEMIVLEVKGPEEYFKDKK